MNTTQVRLTATVAISIVALIAGGCGAASQKTSSSPAARASAASTTEATNYINTVTRLHAPVANASSQFFHTARARLLPEARALQLAYASATHHLQALKPPRAGATEARALLSAWREGARQLARVIARRPFNPGEAWSAAVQSNQTSEQAFGFVLTIP